ncbi:hypothetical protein OHA72_35450 [Dactylosporangium sp. NBC_01737]|uniref:hypothetical protein n=1 Tax=Dactylosporangium sp. NBC_01737 TaxID=2975959 RepID=UPI002E121CBC|nr:hypothetical protein OHA72_35450 [Dactylosporangium sp. NBC_01737]
MNPFPIFFFIFVELPSMGAMLVHKAIMKVNGRETKQLNVWLYRLIGVGTLFLVLNLSFIIGADAACLVLVLLIVGGLIGLAVRRKGGTTGARIGPQSLPGVLGDLSRRSLADLRRAHGRPKDQSETDLHLRAADLMAALRFYRVAVDPRFTDQEIGRQMTLDTPGTITRVMDTYRRLPPTRERDVAIEILRACLPQGLAVTGNLYTVFAKQAFRAARP